jgi:putative ABC transport system permease protein
VAVPRFYLVLVGALASLAMVLAAIGIYGVIGYAVAQRTHEIGVRMALGAHRGDVMLLVIRQGLAIVLAGVAVGLAGAWVSTRALEKLLFQVRAGDAASFAGACLLLVAVALLACYLPARSATRIDPMAALNR